MHTGQGVLQHIVLEKVLTAFENMDGIVKTHGKEEKSRPEAIKLLGFI